ncbi:MAG: glycosyltransferase family 2 protein [Alphaproteobacteria bacterium]
MALSVVVPVRDEAGNIAPLVHEICEALEGACAFEIVYVDDGSNDGTAAELADAMRAFPRLRGFRHAQGLGQSAALRSGILQAQGALIATLDGDGQNDPADIPRLLDAFRAAGAPPALGMVAGERSERQDNALRRLSSRIANRFRGFLLHDGAADTGCGIKLLRREAFLALPYFDHMHRFLPALMRREGYEILFVPVGHRPRLRGRSKYGVFNRLWVGIVDLIGVIWLQRRCRGAHLIYERLDGIPQ